MAAYNQEVTEKQEELIKAMDKSEEMLVDKFDDLNWRSKKTIASAEKLKVQLDELQAAHDKKTKFKRKKASEAAVITIPEDGSKPSEIKVAKPAGIIKTAKLNFASSNNVASSNGAADLDSQEGLAVPK